MSDDFAKLLAKMQADFIDELPERCDRLEAQVMALERRQAGAYDELYRQIHSLKGSGGTFGVSIVTSICHQFESFIGEVHDRFDQPACSAALNYVDLLRQTGEQHGREGPALAAIEAALERLRNASLAGRGSVLLVEPSVAMRGFFQRILSTLPIQLVTLDSGLVALERMLHEPFDLMVASRGLPDLNALALVAAIRESESRNRDIPVILVSSNLGAVPEYLRIDAVVLRDNNLATAVSRHVTELLARRRGQASRI